ncbi:MAG: alpha/beta hydrolase, partial [Planctomycetes bacterium]|nr:alpha/beta hydrolase [Planctomycetota bacterium]
MVARILIPISLFALLSLALASCRLPVAEGLQHTGGEAGNYNFTLDYQVWLPDGYDKNPDKTYPLLVWFHGGGENELGWGRKGKIGDIVRERTTKGELQPFIVVSPSAGAFLPVFRTYERLLLEDVLPSVEKNYRLNGTVVAFGHSMGGLSALMVSLRHPDLFKGVVVASPFVFDTTPWDTPEEK